MSTYKFTVMWYALLKLYVFKTLWIFIFVVLCVASFLMITYNARMEELMNCIVLKNVPQVAELPPENCENVDNKLEVLAEKLTEKEQALRRSQADIKSAEKVLNDLEKKTSTCQDRYRSLMVELKKDVRRTEEEVRLLQNQISALSIRREALKNEVLKQQEDYQRILNNFTKDLENKKVLFRRLTYTSTIEKSRQHPRVSCFGL